MHHFEITILESIFTFFVKLPLVSLMKLKGFSFFVLQKKKLDKMKRNENDLTERMEERLLGRLLGKLAKRHRPDPGTHRTGSPD